MRSRHPRGTFSLLNKTSLSVSDATSTVHVRLIAPNFVTYNSTATLHCNHSVSDAELHKVEFMKDDKKILQYIKDRKPPFLESKVDGANMEVSFVQLTHDCPHLPFNYAVFKQLRVAAATLSKLAAPSLHFFFFPPPYVDETSFRIFAILSN